MRAPPASTTGPAARIATLVGSVSTPGVLVLAAAIPALFLHLDYQPQVELALGGEELTVALSDVAVLAVLAAAVAAARRLGWEPLLRARAPLLAGAALLAVVVAWTFLPVALGRDYPLLQNLITAAKYVEYALLAPAAALLVRTRDDLGVVLAVLVAWAAAASVGAVLQFVGVVPEPRGYRPGEREPSFLGYHDLAALTGAALSVGLVRVALGGAAGLGGALAALAVAAGVVGVVLSGTLAAFIGVTAAAVAIALVARSRGLLTGRRVAAIAAIVAVTGAGVLALRAANIDAFLRFIGVTPSADTDTFGGESYVQRLALGYIGVRTFADHPLEGVGWQSSALPWTYEPYLDDARERFPRVPERLLPGPGRPWGIQNAYLQAAAELGILGALVFLAALLVPLRRAWRAATRADADADAADAALPLLWLLVTMGLWIGLGIVAGIPAVALQWLAVGLVVSAAARARPA